jgi:MFS family permease
VQISDGKVILKETDCENQLGFAYPNSKKWLIITVIFLVQTSMNFNASVYGNAVAPMMERFGITAQTGRLGQMAFLIAYAFGCELWAPWSEELGRWKVLQWSLGLVNLWQIPCALASM